MRYLVFFLLLLTVLLTSGCTNENQNIAADPTVTVTLTPIQTTSIVPTPTSEPLKDTVNDEKFIELAETCFQSTPEILNVSTQLAFTSCMQKTPNPTSFCAKDYKHYVLLYTNDDSTTAGFRRMTNNVHVVRNYFYQNCFIGNVLKSESIAWNLPREKG